MFLFQDRLNKYFEPVRPKTAGAHRHAHLVFGLGSGLSVFYSVISILIFNFHPHVTRIVDSDDICANQFMYEAMSWVLPKAARHCDMLLTPVLYHNPYKGVLIVLDLWIFFIFMSQFFLGFKFPYPSFSKRADELSKVFRKRRLLAINFILLGMFVCSILIYFVFFSVPLVGYPGERSPWLNMLDDYYGIGAGLMSFIVGGLSLFFSGPLLASYGFWKSFQKNEEQTP